MTPGRTIEKKGDTGVQNKDEKTAQGGSMTRQQAEQEMEQLRKVFPSVRMLTAEQVQAGEAVGDAARQALEEKTTHSRMEYRGQELYEVTALFAQVEGTPCVLELERRLDRIMLLDPEESEQLFNNLAEYRGKLYRDAVTGAYNERYYQEKYRSRILTAGVAVLRVDDFKAANDVYGRYAGNSVLETVAGVLRRNLGEKDRLICRGEDRLLLLLPEVGQSDFGQKLEHLRLQLAAALHDIGKMEICEDLLHKEGPLTEAERRTLQSHTLLGAQMLEEQPECRDDAFARTAYNICRWHHERYDGGGYPDGLQGEQIPIEAQVVGLADVYERLVSRPVDGHARTHSEVVQMICTGVCGAFNPLLLDCLQDMEAEIARAMQDTPEET